MYKKTSKNKKSQIDFLKKIKQVLQIFFCIALFIFVRWMIFDVYNPEEKNYIKKSTQAYLLIQDELAEFYKEKGFVYENIDVKQDEFCEVLKKKYGTKYSNCTMGNSIEEPNIELKKGKITIHGFSNSPEIVYGDIVKDLFIDINGLKGDNKFGVDRTPIRIYSNGRMGGMLSPINCNKLDFEEKEVPYSKICPADIMINFMDSKIPFSYNVMQLGGGKKSRTRILNKRVPFLRADCVAFGGEMTGAELFCEARRYYWLTACYHEFPCAIGMGRKDKIRPNEKYLKKEKNNE